MTQLPTILPPWSYTMLEAFEQCNRKAFHRYILKEKGPESAAQYVGNQFDKHAEARIRDGVVLPPEFQQHEPLAGSIAAMRTVTKAKIYTQLKMGITRDFKNCGFFDGGVWGRGVLDILLVAYPTAVIVDWKTGKNNESKPWYDKLQLKIFVLLVLKHFPKVNKVTAFNIWLQENSMGKPLVFTRADEVTLWREVLPKIMAMEKAFATGNWPEMPGALCGYCPVKACQHNRS